MWNLGIFSILAHLLYSMFKTWKELVTYVEYKKIGLCLLNNSIFSRRPENLSEIFISIIIIIRYILYFIIINF